MTKAVFKRRGAAAAFARHAGVNPCSVSLWLRGKFPSRRLTAALKTFRFPNNGQTSTPGPRNRPVDAPDHKQVGT